MYVRLCVRAQERVMCVISCGVCMCVYVRHACVCVCMCVRAARACVRVCVRVCVRHTCMCVRAACVCERWGERTAL